MHGRLLGLIVLTAFAVPISADVITISLPHPSAEELGIDVPERSLTKERVEAQFGAPLVRHASVGEPPISWWDYEGYSVYFESDRVLHTVLKLGLNPSGQ